MQNPLKVRLICGQHTPDWVANSSVKETLTRVGVSLWNNGIPRLGGLICRISEIQVDFNPGSDTPFQLVVCDKHGGKNHYSVTAAMLPTDPDTLLSTGVADVFAGLSRYLSRSMSHTLAHICQET